MSILPSFIKGSAAVSFYNIGITVLSIIFSLFFAALAIILSSTDNEFIMYLEEQNLFTEIMETFKVVLFMLFISLIYSLVFYGTTEFYVEEHGEDIALHSKYPFVIFQFLFTYSLIGTVLSVNDTLKFTSYRTKFLISRKNKGPK